MAVGTWQVFGKAKYYLGVSDQADFQLDAAVFKMALMTSAASAALAALGTVSTWASISAFEIVQRAGGYLSGGRALSAITWGTGASAKQMKWTYTTSGVVFTGTMSAIRYAVIRTSTSAGGGRLLCFCSLTTAPFDVASGNTLTVIPAATGVFTLT